MKFPSIRIVPDGGPPKTPSEMKEAKGIAVDVHVEASILPLVREEAMLKACKTATAFVRSSAFDKAVVDSLRDNIDTMITEVLADKQGELEQRIRGRLAEVWEAEVEKQVRSKVDEALARVRKEMLK